MGKKRKTYKEKVISDLRRKVRNFEESNSVSLEPKIKYTPIKTPVKQPAIVNSNFHNEDTNYLYLIKDISKTGILAVSFVVLQIVLFTILKTNVISIPGINY